MAETIGEDVRGRKRQRTQRDRTGNARDRGATSLRGHVPTLSRPQSLALRAMFQSPQTWTLRDNGLLQFMPGKPAVSAETFEIDAEGTRIGLCLRAVATAPGLHWTDYQGRSRVLAWALAHETQLMRLSEAFGVVLTPIAEPAGDGDARNEGESLWLDFIVDDEPPIDGPVSRMPALQGALRVPPGWTERLLERADPPYDDTPQPLGRWRDLPVPTSLRMGIAPLPHDAWAALRPGDVIVVGRRSRLPAVEAHAQGMAWPLAAKADGWQVSGPPRHVRTHSQEKPTMSETNDAADNPEAAADTVDQDALARQLPVDIAFEIGQAELRVGELSSLQPGYVFPLAAQLEGANVTIRANGQAVGQGEVVAVGDTLGVRLLWWN